MFGLTTRGQLDTPTELEFERFYARLSEFLGISFNEDGTLITTPDTTRVIGEVIEIAGPNLPPKWLFCDGAQVSRVDYKGLFEAIGTTYGVGDGATTFNLPDTRGRFSLSKSASGTGSVLGATGGALDHTHTTGSHSHTFSVTSGAGGGHDHTGSTSSDGDHNHSGDTDGDNDSGFSAAFDVAGTMVAVRPHDHNFTTSTDGDHSHSFTTNNVSDHTHSVSGSTSSEAAGTTGANNPAYIVFNTIIYTGVE